MRGYHRARQHLYVLLLSFSIFIFLQTIEIPYYNSARTNLSVQILRSDVFSKQAESEFTRLQISKEAIQNSGKNFEQIDSLVIKIGDYSHMFKGLNLKEYGIFEQIQVGSEMDFTNISKMVNYSKLADLMNEEIAHQVLSFTYNPNLQLKKKQINFRNAYERNKILRKVSDIQEKDFEFAKILAKNPYDQQIKLQQYYYYDRKYKISQITQQSPICIFSAGYKIFTKDKYKDFFISIERQNYTNFHIVYVDDNSPDDSPYKVFQYLNKLNNRLTNRISIVHNLQHLGALGNMYFWIRRYCKEDDIVIIVDGDDSLMGHQTFQVINAVYKNKNNWYVYSNYVQYYPLTQKYQPGYASSPFVAKTSEYRIMEKHWVTSHLRTFRKKLIDAIPIQNIIEYRYNRQKGYAYPYIYFFSADRFQVYSCLQLAGNDRLVHINDYLYFYDIEVGMSNNCYRYHEYNDEYRSRIKTPLKRLEEFGKKSEYVENYQIPQNILSSLKKESNSSLKCKHQNKKK